MKTIFLSLALAIFICPKIRSQKKKNTDYRIYLTNEISMGTHAGFDADLNFALTQKYSFKFGFAYNVRSSKGYPGEDPPKQLAYLVLSPFAHFDATPDQMTSYQFMAGRYIMLFNQENIRLNLSLGVAYTKVNEAVNWRKGGFDYLSDENIYHTTSFIINPKIEIVSFFTFGSTFSLKLLINKDNTYVGVGIGTMIGKVR